MRPRFGLDSYHQFWRKNNKEFHPENTMPTGKHKVQNVAVFSSHDKRKLQIIEGRMNGATQNDILNKNPFISVKALKIKHN